MSLMGVSTLVRLGFGLLTFAAIARLLGPNMFGVFMLWLSTATLLSLLSNFGFTPYVLREIGMNQATATEVMSEVISAKLLVSSAILITCLAALPFIDDSHRFLFLLLLSAMLADSITDVLNVGYRATNRFSTETKVTTFAAAIQFMFTAISAWASPTTLSVAIAFTLSRFIVLCVTWFSQKNYFSTLSFSNLDRSLYRLNAAKSYAADFGMQSLFGQIDNLVLNFYVGPVAVGIYQAGMRIFLAGTQAASVVGNVLIPHAASFNDDLPAQRKVNSNIVGSLLAIGLLGGIAFATIPKGLVAFVLGSDFVQLGTMLLRFGVLFFARFTAASIGTVLTIQGLQTHRAFCTLAHWVFIAIYCYEFQLDDATDWITILIYGHMTLIILYSIALKMQSHDSISKFSWALIIISLLSIGTITLC